VTTELPHDLDAERAVLGAALTSAAALAEVTGIVTGADFYKPAHEATWAAVVALHDQGRPVDTITVVARMQEDGTLHRFGGPLAVHDLAASVITAANAGYHARIVLEHAARRRLIAAGTRIVQVASGAEATTSDLVATALDELTAAARPTRLDTPTLVEQVNAAIDAIETSQSCGWNWPWTDVRRVLVPPAPGNFVLFAARPGVGKSVTLIDLARHIAIHCNLPVVLHTLEMSATEVIHRIVAAEERIPLDHIKQNTLTDDEWGRVAAAVQKIVSSPLVIVDDPTAGVPEVRASIRTHRPAAVLFDYFQLGRTNPAVKDRRQALEEMSRGFKLLAKEEQVPVIAAAQVNRKSQDRTTKVPMLSDLRETGSLEQDCDTAVMIHREDVEEPECERAGEVDMIVAKQRHGGQGRAVLVHQLHYSRFVDMAA